MIVKNRASEKAQSLASYCMDAQGRAYNRLGVDHMPHGLARADIIAHMADDIGRGVMTIDGTQGSLTAEDIRKAADILTDNNAHMARRILELMTQ